MPDITSDSTPEITANGNYDIINLRPGATYALKFQADGNEDYGGGTVDIEVKDGDGVFHALDDSDASGIDGTGTTEFRVKTIGTAIRLVVAGSTDPSVTFSCVREDA